MFPVKFDFEKALKAWKLYAEQRAAYAQCATMRERWALLRAIYRERMPDILAASVRRSRGRIDPYFVSWDFTPIEEAAWQSIRYYGIPFYPEVPVGRFFIDFASPYFKIGLELDGKDFHDQERDRKRDALLGQSGWRIFRVTGAEAMACSLPPIDYAEGDEDANVLIAKQWLLHTSDGVIAALDQVYFRERPLDWPYFDLALQTLECHRLADFPILPPGEKRYGAYAEEDNWEEYL